MPLSQKTWLPQLLRIATKLCSYMRRYEEQIKKPMTDSQKAVFDAALVACTALEAVVEVLLPPEI